MPRKEKKYHFIYKTTNLLSGKYYIGMHSTDNIEDGYLGSGKRLRYSINKYGVENHKREIVEFVESRKELISREKEIVNLNEIAKEDCMNLMVGGKGGFISEEQQKKRSEIANKKLNFKLKNDFNFLNFFRKNVSMGLKNSYKNGRIGKNYFSWKGKKRSEETRLKISNANKGMGLGNKNSQYGTKWINKDGISKKIKVENIDDFLKNGWELGTIKKISNELLEEILQKRKNEKYSYSRLSKEYNIPKSTIAENIRKRCKCVNDGIFKSK